jgi:hypothetical protein
MFTLYAYVDLRETRVSTTALTVMLPWLSIAKASGLSTLVNE